MKRKTTLLALCLVFLFLQACAGESSSDYFTLPQSTRDDAGLRTLLSQEEETGFVSASPLSGSYRQPLQLIDINGDGTEEVLAFLRNSSAESCRIKIYSSAKGSYEPVLSIEGKGSSLYAVDCVDVTGDGVCELICSWSCGAELNLIYVYDLREWGGEVLLSDSCTEFLCTDLTGNGTNDLLTISLVGKKRGVELFSFPISEDGAAISADLSAGIRECCRICPCLLEGNTPAVLVESYLESGELVSDLFSLLDGKLYNVTLDRQSGVSQTKRSYAVSAADIDGDQFLEVPISSTLFAQKQGDHYRYLRWVGFNRYGYSVIKQETYHCFPDGWYFVLPEGWGSTLTVRRESSVAGERCVVLSSVDPYTGDISDKLFIYTLSGENRMERAKAGGRFILAQDEATVYAASVKPGVDSKDVKARFHLIYAEWTKDSF